MPILQPLVNPRPRSGYARWPVRARFLFPLVCAAAACAPPPPRVAIVGGHIVAQPAFRAPLLMLDAATGEVSAKVPADGYADAPPAAKGYFFVHGDAGLVARDAATGAPRWRVFSKVSYFTRPVVSADAVFVFDPKPSQHLWRGYAATSGAKIFDVPCDDHAPLASGGGLLFTFQDGALVAHNAEDGKTKYRVEKDAEAPILAAEERFYARIDDLLGVFRSENGRLERTVDVGDDALETVGGVAPGLAVTTDLIVAAGNDTVRAIDAGSGKKLWEAAAEDAESVSIAGGMAVVGAGEAVLGFDANTGKKRWSTQLSANVLGVQAAGGMVAARAGEGQVVILDLSTGKRRFARPL